MVSKVGPGEEASSLDELSEQHIEYGLFVTAGLDHMEGMLLGQVRKVISILVSLALRVGGNGGCGDIQDDLNIVNKKRQQSCCIQV